MRSFVVSVAAGTVVACGLYVVFHIDRSTQGRMAATVIGVGLTAFAPFGLVALSENIRRRKWDRAAQALKDRGR